MTFTSHYFSPLPKKVKGGKKLRASRNKKNRSLVPFRHTVETPAGHRQHKGFTQAELFDGRLPNKYDDPRQNMKKTKAPAPQISFVEFEAAVNAEGEVDTTEEMEAEEEAEAPVPPPFQHDEGEQVATIVQTEEFFSADHQVPTWADEEATESVLVEEAAEAEAEVDAAQTIKQMTQITIDQSKLPRLVPVAPVVSAHDALEQAEDLEAFLESEHMATASFVEIAEEEEETDEEEVADEAEEEAEDEAEDAAEDQDEAEDGVDEEAEDEAEDEAEAEAEDEAEETEFAFVESAANTQEDSVDAEMDEMEQNELAASQVDMDSQSDEAAMTADENDSEEEVESEVVEDMDADEESSAEEADTTEEVIEEDEAVEDAENAAAMSLVEESSDAEEVDTLLSEIDAQVHEEGEADSAVEAEAEGEQQKGTPGHSIAAGQTWEDAQNERLNAMAAQLEAEKAATPKVVASMVSSKAELHSIAAPEYDSAEAAVETVEPELLVETAAAPAVSSQTVLLEKIAKLKAIRRA